MNCDLPGHDLCSLSPPMANEIQYVTRDELQTALEAQDKRFDAKLDMMLGAILSRMDAMSSRMDALTQELRTTRDDLRAEFRTGLHEVRTELRADLHATRDELRAEIRTAATGIEESKRMTAVETRTEELVPRVEHIERTLFAPEPPKRRRRAQRR